MKTNNSLDLKKDPSIAAVNQIMKSLETDIKELKSGAVSEGKARIIVGARRAQLRVAEVTIMAARLQMQAQRYFGRS